MDFSSSSPSHLLGDRLGALLSLPLDFYHFAIGILTAILSSFNPTPNTLTHSRGYFIMAKTDIDISEGGFWFSTDSRKLWSPTVVVPATLIAVFFILARFRDGYDGIYPLPIVYLLLLIAL